MIQVTVWWCLPFCAKIRTLNPNRCQNTEHPLFFEVHLYHVILIKCLSFKVLFLKWQMPEAPRKACSSAALHLESFDITCSVKGQAHRKHFWLPSQEMYLWTICSSEVKENSEEFAWRNFVWFYPFAVFLLQRKKSLLNTGVGAAPDQVHFHQVLVCFFFCAN